jgi:hypothetical protein
MRIKFLFCSFITVLFIFIRTLGLRYIDKDVAFYRIFLMSIWIKLFKNGTEMRVLE